MQWERKDIFVGVLIVATSNAGSGLNAFYPEFRADGFTGLDAIKLEQKLRAEYVSNCNSLRRVMQDFAIRLNLNEYVIEQCGKQLEELKEDILK